jgi:flagellar motor switch protein FliN/FliY
MVKSLPDEENLVKISFRLTIGDLIDSTIMQLLTVKFSKDMVNLLINGTEEPEQVPTEAAATLGAPSQAVNTDAQNMHQAPPNTMPPQAGYGMQPEMPYSGMPMQGGYDPNQQMQYAAPPQHFGGMPNRNINVQPIQFSNFQNNPQIQVDPNNLNLLMDIPLKVTVELGRTHKQIKDILELSQGSIVELDKLAGEPVDILVNNKLIAKGEVVVIDENFGVRVIDIVSQWDRIQKIQ